MIIFNRKPVHRYIAYNIEKQQEYLYKITITYFIDKGNPISDIDIRYTKFITCTKGALPDKIKSIEKNIDNTSIRLSQALYRNGASEANILHILKEKMTIR